MTQKQLHEKLGGIFNTLDTTLSEGKYNEKLINTAKVMSAVAKQMIQSADVSIRASKMLGDKTLLQGIFTNE
jgi:hypothetical protein